ncbi:MAG: hypothetical protein ABW224_10445 [Kibdelosporangium sp.]
MSDYKGLDHYGPPPKKRDATVLALVIAAVVVLGATGALLFVRVVSTTTGQALPVDGAGPVTSTKPRDPLQPKATGGPQVPGWQAIPISNGGTLDTDKAYDVPPSWRPIAGGLATFGDHSEISLVAPAIHQQGHCPAEPKSWRSMAGLAVLPNKGDIEVGAAAAAQLVANTVFTTQERVQPETEISDPQPVTVFRNRKAVVVTAKLKIPVTDKDKCATPAVTLAVMMMEPNKEGDADSVSLVAMGDQSVPGATAERDLVQIVTSFHLIT